MSPGIKNKLFVVLLLLFCFGQGQAQFVNKTFPSGSYVIGMDTATQPGLTYANTPPGYDGGGGGTTPFNLRAYGLVHALLNSHIPVNWCIAQGKAKDGIDFSANVTQIFPSVGTPGNLDFRAGPFVIDSLWMPKAIPIIAAYGNGVRVYQLNAPVATQVRHELAFMPRIILLTSGANAWRHDSLMVIAGINDTVHLDTLGSQVGLGQLSCYTFASEPHWRDGTGVPYAQATNETNPMRNFVLSGGNILIQCAGIEAYENTQLFHTTAGMDGNGNYSGAQKADTHTEMLLDFPFMQFNDSLTHDPTGTFVNWRPTGGGCCYEPTSRSFVEKNNIQAGQKVAAVIKMTPPATSGGRVFYLGGHDYRQEGGSNFRAFNLHFVNGIRMYLNATLVPSTRPDSCGLVFAADDSLSKTVNPGPYSSGDTAWYNIIVCNNGPGTSYDLTVQDVLPGGFVYAGHTATTGSYNPGSGIWTVGTLPNGACDTLVLGAQVFGNGVSTNTAWISSPQAGNSLTNDTATASVLINGCAVAYAGPDTSLCGSTFQLMADTLLPGYTGQWTLLSGGGTIASTADPNSPVTALPPGANVFEWIIQNGSCADTSTVSLTAFAPVNSIPGPADTVCGPDAQLNASPGPGGTWSLISGSGVFADPNLATTAVSGLSLGTNTFQWLLVNGVCRDSAQVSIESLIPPLADPGPNDTVCGFNYQFNPGNLLPGEKGEWAMITGTGVIDSLNLPQANVSGLSIGSNLAQWIVYNPGCSDTAYVTIEVLPTPLADAGQDTAVCGLMADLASSNGQQGLWTVVTGAGNFGNPNSPNTSVSGLVAGTNTFQWWLSNGTCSDSATVKVTAFDSVVAFAGNDTSICLTTLQLFGSSNPFVAGSWQVQSGSGTLTGDSLGNVYVSGLSPGVNTLNWEVQNGPCRDQDMISIAVDTTSANAGANQTLCEDERLLLNAYPNGSGTWHGLGTAGQFSDSSSSTTQVFPLIPATTTLVWEYDNGSCITSDSLMVSIRAMPSAANAGFDLDLQVGGEQQLSANTPVVGSGIWTVAGSGSVSPANQFDATYMAGAPGVDTLYWTISNPPCPDKSDFLLALIAELVIPNGFSPNADGVNDAFVISGLENFPGASLIVFNRWGSKVYESAPYLNDWTGTDGGNEPLADDTYFIELDLGNDEKHAGFVVIKR